MTTLLAIALFGTALVAAIATLWTSLAQALPRIEALLAPPPQPLPVRVRRTPRTALQQGRTGPAVQRRAA